MRFSKSGTERRRVLYLLTNEVSTIFVRGQLAAIREAGFDVHLAANFTEGVAQVDEGIAVSSIPFVRDPSPAQDLRALWATWRLIRRTRPSIVHAGTPKAGLLGMLAAWSARTPARCYALHGLRYETSTGGLRRLLIILERVACACATVVVADSNSMRDVAVRDRLVKSSKVIVLGSGSSNGVDTERFRPATDKALARRNLGLDRFGTVIGFIGRLTRDKGVDDLVSVFSEQFEGRPEVGLLLVGPAEEGDPLAETTVARIATDPRIVWVQWLDDTSAAYHAMDVLAFPSYREGLPNVPLEAQACGVPVVGYAATGTVDAVSDNDRLIDVGDTGQLGSMLEQVVRSSGLAGTPDDNLRSWVTEHFDQRTVWSRRAALFRDISA